MMTRLLVLFLLGMFQVTVVSADLPDTVIAVKKSIVGVGTIHPTRTPRVKLRGTGFAIGDGSYIVTNAHVVDHALDEDRNEAYAVFSGRGTKYKVFPVKRVAIDFKHDLAILRTLRSDLPGMVLGNSGSVREGQQVAFTGFPIGSVLGLFPATHRGIVSSITPIVTPASNSSQLDVRQIKRLGDPYDVFQLDATAYPGNSGSPLYRPQNGRVIGVLNMVFVKESKENVLSKPSGISYAIPVNYVNELYKQAVSNPMK